MKLYRVEVSDVVYVVAESAREAGRKAMRQAHSLELEVASTTRVDSMSEVPADWHDALPYGAMASIRELFDRGEIDT